MNRSSKAPSDGLCRILLVGGRSDDDRFITDLLDAVPGVRFLIDRARGLEDGRRFLDQGRFDVCLLEPDLPDGSGLDLLASATATGSAPPTIMIDGSGSDDADRRAMALGAAGFLDRDRLDPVTLERTLRYAIHHHKLMTNLARRALRDEATGLISAPLFRDRLDRSISHAGRSRRLVALMMIDLGFDSADSQDKDDERLAAAGRRLADGLRQTDSIARLGARRLALLIEGLRTLNQAAMVGRKIAGLLAAPADIKSEHDAFAASLGAAIYPDDGLDGDDLLRRAETALGRARALGSGACSFASQRIDDEVQALAVTDKAFRGSLERRDLRLRFHPEVHLKDRRPALVAQAFWPHPNLGWQRVNTAQGPTAPAAIVGSVVNWTLAAAAEQLLAWQRAGLEDVTLSLPMPWRSGETLSLLEEAVRRQVLARDAPPERLTLDLQEEPLQRDARQGSPGLRALKATGIGVALDDVGGGRLAMEALRHDLIDGLKLIPDLCRPQESDDRCRKLLRALIGLGHDLDLTVTAKGVPKQPLLVLLKQLGCDAIELNGSPPKMDADNATHWLRNQRGSLTATELTTGVLTATENVTPPTAAPS